MVVNITLGEVIPYQGKGTLGLDGHSVNQRGSTEEFHGNVELNGKPITYGVYVS